MRGRELYQLTQLAQRYLQDQNIGGQVRAQVQQAMSQVQEAFAGRTDEATRLARKRRRLERKRVWASRWATTWALLCAICMVFTVAVFTGAVADGQGAAAVGGIAVALVTGTLSIRSMRRMVLLKQAQREFDERHGPGASLPQRPASALPPKGSAAREPMQRLAEAERALDQVLAQLSATGAVPAESIAQSRATGTEAATALRAVAAQLTTVELARDHAPPLERGPLVEGIARLRDQLDEGLDGYRSLVAAAGRVVAASSAPGPKQELTEATDHLAGLAVALRELSDAAGA